MSRPKPSELLESAVDEWREENRSGLQNRAGEARAVSLILDVLLAILQELERRD